MTDFDVDLFVIGAGSGGVRAARIAAGYGARVMIAEEFRIGGTCVIRGCVPKKLYVYASRFRDEFEDAAGFGWDLPGEPSFDWSRLVSAKENEITRLSGLYRKGLDGAGVSVVECRAEVEGPHEVRLADGRLVTAKYILVAVGGAPVRAPAVPGVEHAITSNEIFDLDVFPKSLFVVGGGYIAVEFASVFARLGAQVTMAIRADTSPLAGARAHALLELAGLVTDHDGRRSAHRRGGGVELRELRDYVPGDPLRAVAWKATARRQRPLVRTTEDDTRHHLQLLVDVGPALRVGPEGERPLDRLLDLAAALLQAASADRVGLTLFDTRIVSHLDAEVGHAALRRCKQRLLDATHLVDDDLTEVPDTEVLARVAAHLDRDAPGQFDFTRSARARASFTLSSVDPLREAIDESAVHTAVARALLADRAKARSLVAQRVRSARWAKDPSGARLRLACAMFGLPLEYRSAPDSAGRNAGFAEALLRGRRPGGPRTLVVLSDLSTLDPQGQAGRALRTLSHHKQQVVLLCPPSTPEEAVVAWRRAGATVQRVSSPRSGSSGESPSLRSSRLRPIPSSRDAADRLPPQASTT
jgi:hypothetical protein